MYGNVHFDIILTASAREFRPVYAASAGSVSLITFDIRHFPDEARVSRIQRKPLQFGSVWVNLDQLDKYEASWLEACFGFACFTVTS